MPVNNVTSLPGGIGNLLQIAFASGFVRQLSQDLADFRVLQLMRVGQPQGRELRYMLHTGGGPAAVQSAAVDTIGSFPVPQDSVFEEKIAIFKQLDSTVRISDSLAKRLGQSGNIKYAEQLAAEIEDKLVYSKRRVGADMHLDGTGVMGTVASVVATTGTGAGLDQVVVTLSTTVNARGHVNVCEYNDLFVSHTAAGVAAPPTITGTFAAWKIIDVRRDTNAIVLQPINAAGAALAMSDAVIAAGNVFYRIGQATILNLTTAIGDYGSATEICVGLESLIADDGRLVNGTTMSGATKSVVYDKTGEVADIRHLMQLVSALKNRNGQSASYKWNKVLCASEYIDTLVEAQRQDIRYQPGDGKLGSPGLTFCHGDTRLEFNSSEFCRRDRQWLVPTGGEAGKTPVQFRFADFQAVKSPDNGSAWNLSRAATTARAVKSWEQYMSAFIGAYNLAPSSCGLVKGATVAL